MIDNIKEYILCAANWYPNLTLVRKDIPKGLLLPKNLTKGIVFAGFSHANCLYQMVVMTGLRQDETIEIQGFITSNRRFVNRKKALKIAMNSRQIKEGNYSNKQLYSEDLY